MFFYSQEKIKSLNTKRNYENALKKLRLAKNSVMPMMKARKEFPNASVSSENNCLPKQTSTFYLKELKFNHQSSPNLRPTNESKNTLNLESTTNQDMNRPCKDERTKSEEDQSVNRYTIFCKYADAVSFVTFTSLWFFLTLGILLPIIL